MSEISSINRAKIKVTLQFPFFSSILLKRPLVEDRAIPTACTDGEQIWYSPDFFNSLTSDEGSGVLIHEVMHIILFHSFRRMGRDPEIWNYACDYVINMILEKKAKVILPKSRLLDERFEGMTEEQVYDILFQEAQENPSSLNNLKAGGIGEVKDFKGTSSQAREAKVRINTDVTTAHQIAKVKGNMPAGMERVIKTAIRSNMNWREILAAFLNQVQKSDYSFSRPNARFLHMNVYLPVLNNEETGNFVMACDTSQSVSNKLLAKGLGIIEQVLGLSGDVLPVLYCDTEVHVQELTKDSPDPVRYIGNGGTDFAPVNKWVAENLDTQPSALLYLTDGECDSFGEEPAYPVMWVTDNLNFDPPFGECIFINDAPEILAP